MVKGLGIHTKQVSSLNSIYFGLGSRVVSLDNSFTANHISNMLKLVITGYIETTRWENRSGKKD